MTANVSQPTQSQPGGIARFIPILQWAPKYQRIWLRPDLIAGLTVAALVVPKSLEQCPWRKESEMSDITRKSKTVGDEHEGRSREAITDKGTLFPKRLKTPRAAAIAGIIFALLFATFVALVRLSIPTDPSDAGNWVADSERKNLVVIAFNLIPFAGIAFLWFIGVTRDRLGELEDRFFGTVFLGSGLLFIGLLFTSIALGTSLIVSYRAAPGTASEIALWSFGRRAVFTLMNVYTMRMAAVFTISTCTIALRTAIFNRWLVYLGYAVALVLLLAATSEAWINLLFPFWILLVSLDILQRNLRGQHE
jgi:hypothetical protein